MIDDFITHGTWCHLCKKYSLVLSAQAKTFDLIGLLSTNHVIMFQWHTGRFMRNTCDVNIKIAQTTQSIWILWSESQGYWRKGNLWQLSRRYGPKTGVSLPPLGCIVTKVLWKIAQTVTYTVQSDFVLRCFRYSWHLMNQDALIVASICWDGTFHFKRRGLILGISCITCLVEHSCGSS